MTTGEPPSNGEVHDMTTEELHISTQTIHKPTTLNMDVKDVDITTQHSDIPSTTNGVTMIRDEKAPIDRFNPSTPIPIGGAMTTHLPGEVTQQMDLTSGFHTNEGVTISGEYSSRLNFDGGEGVGIF